MPASSRFSARSMAARWRLQLDGDGVVGDLPGQRFGGIEHVPGLVGRGPIGLFLLGQLGEQSLRPPALVASTAGLPCRDPLAILARCRPSTAC